MKTNLFQDQVVIVTGASAAIGKSLALMLVSQCAKVVIAARRAYRFAEIILSAAEKRRRQVLMGPGLLATWLKVAAPGFLDWLTYKVFLEPAIRRAKAGKIEVTP